jgi:hypothetical protein
VVARVHRDVPRQFHQDALVRYVWNLRRLLMLFCSQEGAGIIRTHWPKLYKHFRDSIRLLIKKRQITEDEVFGGIFLQFCPNLPTPDEKKPINNVFCLPHIDSKNVALGLCLLFVYSRRKRFPSINLPC